MQNNQTTRKNRSARKKRSTRSAPSTQAAPVAHSRTQEGAAILHPAHLAPLLVSLSAGAATMAALWHSPAWPGSTDAIYFIKGLTDYDLTRLRPQWPGYPVYMALSAGLERVPGVDPARALHLISAAGAACSVALTGLIAATLNPQHPGRSAGLGSALLGLSAGLILTGSDIYSDTTGLALGLGGALAALRGRGLLAGALLGLSLGARPSELPLLLMLAGLPARQWRSAALALGLSVSIWLGAQLLILSPQGYVTAARTHLQGHYDRWGGGLASRPVGTWGTQLMSGAQTAWTHGVGGWWPQSGLNTPLRLSAAIWPVAWLLGHPQRRGHPARRLLWTVLAATITWTALNHDVRLDRYWLTPLALLAALISSAGDLWTPRNPAWLRPALISSLMAALLTQATELRRLTLHNPPAEYQAAQWAGRQGQPGQVTILSAEPTPLMGAGSPVQSVKKLPADPDQQNRALRALAPSLQRQGQEVFLISTEPAPDDWQLAHVATRPRQVRSREVHELMVWRFSPLPVPDP